VSDAGVPVTLPGNRSGSRLKRRRWTTPEGVEGPGAPEDTTLGVSCGWGLATDGKFRCLPGPIASLAQFADPQCTQLVYLGRRTCLEPAAYLSVPSDPATCPPSFAVRKRGAKLDLRAYYQRAADGTCATVAMPLTSSSEDLYAVGEELPPGTFVAAERATVPAPGGFATVYLEAEDGSRSFYSYVDPVTGADCWFTTPDQLVELRLVP
jgi:hypothetical protein